jgi:hypothetical protein
LNAVVPGISGNRSVGVRAHSPRDSRLDLRTGVRRSPEASLVYTEECFRSRTLVLLKFSREAPFRQQQGGGESARQEREQMVFTFILHLTSRLRAGRQTT